MVGEKRTGGNPVPNNINKYLNDAQQAQLRTIEGFGWNLEYIRRPAFQKSVVVVTNPDGSSIGILKEDGKLDLNPNIETRK